MPASTQLIVALELDFPENLVRYALLKMKFATAGDLCDYLDTHKEELEVEVKEEEEKKRQEEAEEKKRREEEDVKDSSNIDAAKRELTLMEETELLYKKSRCAMCMKNKRSFVTLPCSHFTLCSTCETKARCCPLSDCREPIDCTIATFGY